MEECEAPPARFKRRAWAQSRDSWQGSEAQEQGSEEQLSPQPVEDKPATASQSGPIPNKITSWLRDCRTPLGSSLDEQSSSPSKGPLKNGCSFEDDLSLGADANHLQKTRTAPEANGYELPAQARRCQFKQKGRSMNSTGSGKSSASVSSVSELLDLYEEDPEEILYNLGFGHEEPDIASKIPSRFFNSSSGAKGIDIKVYLEAQIQRMELENPTYALTSRFRQTEVLATVANVFSEIYSQVSGRPTERIGSSEIETKTPSTLKRNNSALNVAKILKRNITKQNLLTPSTEGAAKQPSASDGDSVEGVNPVVSDRLMDVEQKPQQKIFRRKDSSLATVTEEAHQGFSEASLHGDNHGPFINGDHSAEVPNRHKDLPDSSVLVSISKASDESDLKREPELKDQERQETITSTPDKEPPNLLPNPHIAHLLSQPRDSFEMEELQSNEDEALSGPVGMSRAGSERLLRTASQQSDSSGFADDPSTDGSSSHLKVQESSDSCDSETTVTSHVGDATAPAALEISSFERLQGEEAHLQSSQSGTTREVPENTSLQIPSPNSDNISIAVNGCSHGPLLSPEEHSHREPTVESGSTTTQIQTSDSSDVGIYTDPVADSISNTVCTSIADQRNVSHPGLGMDLDFSSRTSIPSQSGAMPESSEDLCLSSSVEHSCGSESSTDLGTALDLESLSAKEQRKQIALHTTQQRSSSLGEERPGRVWVRDKDLLKGSESLDRNPLKRSSSLPTSPNSPARVVTSMRIQLGRGTVKHCTPPSYTYHYEEEVHANREEVDSILEEDEDIDRVDCQSAPFNTAIAGGSMFGIGYGTPPHPLKLPSHLTRSSSSLYSVPADWPPRSLAEGPSWSTFSVPNLSHFAGPAHPPPPHGPIHSPHLRMAHNSSYPTSLANIPHHSPLPHPQSFPHLQNLNGAHPLQNNAFTPPQGSPFTPQNRMHFPHPHSAPYYNPTTPFHSPYNLPHDALYGSSFSMHGSPHQPHNLLSHPNSAPYSLAYNCSPHALGTPPTHPYYPPYPLSCGTPTPPAATPAMGSTEMQLRRVLHDIHDTMQSLSQSSSVCGGNTPVDRSGTPRSVQPLYEELQMRRGNLNMFRTQMMDLELDLIRQQSMVYQHLSPEERREADQLQTLRTAVRQELQELQLQLEDRLLNLNERTRSSSQHSGLYRHHMALHRGHSTDSLSNSSALRAMEPVTDLLREQLHLQSELGYEAATSTSSHSSRASSPGRFNRTLESCSPSPKQGGVYRATLTLTPSVPPRAGVEVPQLVSPQETKQGISPTSCELIRDDDELALDGRRSRTTEDCSPTEWRSRSGGHGDLQHLIKEIKESIASEIRQEIVNELLAAVSPQRSPHPDRKPPCNHGDRL